MISSAGRDALRTLREAALALIALTAVLLGGAGAASAHAALVGVEPADGSVVAVAPAAFFITFNEPTAPLVLKLVRPDGSAVALDRVALKDTTLEIGAPEDLRDGTYLLSWRVVSEDGHPVGGTAVFSIGAPSAAGPPAAPATTADGRLVAALWAARVAVYAGLFLGVGGLFFINWIGGAAALARPLRLFLAAGLGGAFLSVGLQGLDALGLPLSALAAAAPWRAGWQTSYGPAAAIAAAGMLAAFFGAPGRPLGRILSAGALAAVGVSLAASGHASAAAPQALTRPAVFLHGVGIAFWAGALVPLAAALTAGPQGGAVLRRFSRVIPLAVLPLAASGLILALVQLRHPDALWGTAYGRVLLLKLSLLVPLFGLAALNRISLTGPAERGVPRAIAWLRRSIRIELVLVLAILATAALWRFTPPPRALAEAAAAPAAIHLHGAKAMADLEITPGRAGPARATIALQDAAFGPLAAREVTLVLADPARGIEPIRRPAVRADDGRWRIDGLTLPQPGHWVVRIDILISDFELTRLEGAIEIRP